MTALADMEELLGRISNRDMVDYMREALTCYGAGAYRGCIVLSYIALYDDLRAKLAELAKINTAAKSIWQEVENRRGNQEVFESYMADQLQKEKLLTKAEHKQLEIIRDIRNRSAHPSGVHAKPEEARYVYRCVIDDFLAQQLLKTTHAVDAVVARLPKANLFPTTVFEDVVEIARSEVAEVHPSAFPYLVKELLQLRGDADPVVDKNAGRLLAALGAFEDKALSGLIQKKLVEACSHDPDYGPWIGRAIAVDAGVLTGLKPDAVLRVRALLKTSVVNPTTRITSKLSHPVTQLAQMVDTLGEETVLADYKEFADAVLGKWPYALPLLDALVEAPKMRAALVEIWLDAAGSSQWDASNPFASAAPQLDDYADIFLTEEEAFKVVIAVTEAADWSGRNAKALRAESFASTPNIKAMALAFAKKKPVASGKLVTAAHPGTSLKDFLAQELNTP
jgi:hypothetical protein